MEWCQPSKHNDSGLGEYVKSTVRKVNEGIIVFFHFITMGDAQNDSASGAMKD